MLQQTTVAAVKAYFLRFLANWPTLEDLANAADHDVMEAWAGLGYYARARNLLKCARLLVTEHGGKFPRDRGGLMKLPGIGPYTSAAIASIAFDRPETVVDGNVERVMSRMYRVNTPLPAAKPELTELATALTSKTRPGDYAQAVMDLGATVCTPRLPKCDICPWSQYCQGFAVGDASDFPRKLPKKPKPTRYGIVYIVRRADGAWLLERRPESGLLGGMPGWPGAPWGATAQEIPPLEAEWEEVPGEVRHTFTHFHLSLALRVSLVGSNATPRTGSFVAAHDFRPTALPTVMRKAYDHALTHLTQSATG